MQRIDQILVRQYRGTSVQPVIDVARLYREWPRVMPEPWAAVSRPLRLQNGVLYLTLPDASWAQRLAYEGRMLARKIEAFLGYAVTLRHRIEQPEPPLAPWQPVAPLADDPRVLAAVAAAPAGVLRDALNRYFSRLAAFQDRNHSDEETK